VKTVKSIRKRCCSVVDRLKDVDASIHRCLRYVGGEDVVDKVVEVVMLNLADRLESNSVGGKVVVWRKRDRQEFLYHLLLLFIFFVILLSLNNSHRVNKYNINENVNQDM